MFMTPTRESIPILDESSLILMELSYLSVTKHLAYWTLQSQFWFVYYIYASPSSLPFLMLYIFFIPFLLIKIVFFCTEHMPINFGLNGLGDH